MKTERKLKRERTLEQDVPQVDTKLVRAAFAAFSPEELLRTAEVLTSLARTKLAESSLAK